MHKSTGNPVYEIDETADFHAQLRDLRLWVATLSRRVEELEASAFQLVEEEVILVALPNTKKLCDGGLDGSCSMINSRVRPRSSYQEF